MFCKKSVEKCILSFSVVPPPPPVAEAKIFFGRTLLSLSFTEKTVINFEDEKCGFTLNPNKMNNNQYEFHVDEVFGDFEITQITAKGIFGNSNICINYINKHKMFNSYKNYSNFHFTIVANVHLCKASSPINTKSCENAEMNGVINIMSSELISLKPYEFIKSEMIFYGKGSGKLKFNYYAKKVGKNEVDDIEIQIVNPYGIEMNKGQTSDFVFQASSSNGIHKVISFEYDPSTIEPHHAPIYDNVSNEVLFDTKQESVISETQTNPILYKIMSNEKFSDVILVASDGKKVSTNRFILHEFSKIFAEILDKNDALPIKIDVENFEKDTVEAAMDFLYGKPEAIKGKEEAVFKFAIKYEIRVLMKACCSYFEDTVLPSTVCEFIQIASLHSFEELKTKCLKVLVEGKKQVDPCNFASLPKEILVDFYRSD